MKKENAFALLGNVVYSKDSRTLSIHKNSFLVCEGGIVRGVFSTLPDRYKGIEIKQHKDNLIIPALYDLHTHAPQYTFCGTGMDEELVEWLRTHTYAEEEKYADAEYARAAYTDFVNELTRGATARACVFATVHTDATLTLMQMLENSGLVTMVGRVNMDRNAPESLIDSSADEAYLRTRSWICDSLARFKRTRPILTPRFIPTCSDELMQKLGELQREFSLAVQSHLSENKAEIEWVRRLCPDASCYADAYKRFGLFGDGVPTVMAHCVHPSETEFEMMLSSDITVAHCPASNMNLASGIAPVSKYVDSGIKVGLGTDVGAGQDLSMLRAVTDAVQASKLLYCFTEGDTRKISLNEAFYLATAGSGSFFGKCGSFDEGYEFDALVLDDSSLATARDMSVKERLERSFYLERRLKIKEKYVCGKQIF